MQTIFIIACTRLSPTQLSKIQGCCMIIHLYISNIQIWAISWSMIASFDPLSIQVAIDPYYIALPSNFKVLSSYLRIR